MEFRFSLLGDIAFNGLISLQPEENIKRYSSLIPYFTDVDIVFANLEVPVKSGNEVNEYKTKHYFSEEAVNKDLLSLLNIGCVSLANNHIFDLKTGGLKGTIQILDDLNIFHTGAGWKPEHVAPVILNLGQRKIGFLAYVDKSTNPKTENFPELLINYFDLKKAEEEIQKLKKEVDVVICSMHWGKDYSFYPELSQISVAHELVDAGADIIMGHHPHTIQPVEIYKEACIFYSLGGITYGDEFIDGELRALKRKTKDSFFAIFKDFKMIPKLVSTHELKGNFVVINNRDIWKWSRLIWKRTKYKNKYRIINYLIDLQEDKLSRIYEFIFGYHRNIFKDLFSFATIRKLARLFKIHKSDG